jgi:hypothetical protein
MPMCDPCKELANQLKDAPAHDALVLTFTSSLSKASMGMAKGDVLHYKCNNCGTKLSCDCDSRDPGAGWYVVKEG